MTIDKTTLAAPVWLEHLFIGNVCYTEQCAALEECTGNITLNGEFSSLYVEHEGGDIREVSPRLLKVVKA